MKATIYHIGEKSKLSIGAHRKILLRSTCMEYDSSFFICMWEDMFLKMDT